MILELAILFAVLVIIIGVSAIFVLNKDVPVKASVCVSPTKYPEDKHKVNLAIIVYCLN